MTGTSIEAAANGLVGRQPPIGCQRPRRPAAADLPGCDRHVRPRKTIGTYAQDPR
jgi:hypothetical protein